MGFEIDFGWKQQSANPEERNERLAAMLLTKFHSLRSFPLDLDAVARSIQVPRREILQHWCQIELDDCSDEGVAGPSDCYGLA